MRWRQTALFWDDRGARNPFGVILTGADHQPRDWDPDVFFRIGADDVARVMGELAALAPALRRGDALDFGCGVGRITRALASHFERVLGLDVAPSMVEHARRLNAAFPRCRFQVNRAARLRGIPDGAFDFVYSRLVLQHIPPRPAKRYVADLVRVLAPGGVLMFQLPEPIEHDRDHLYRAEQRAFIDAPIADTPIKRLVPPALIRLYRRARFRRLVPKRRHQDRMYMFGLTRGTVLDAVERAGGAVLRIDDDRSHGEAGAGYVYWITKTGATRGAPTG